MDSASKILINLMQISRKSPTGSFVYAENLLRHLFKIDKENNYVLLVKKNDCRFFKEKFGKRANVKYRVIDIRRDIYANPARAILKFVCKYTGNKRGTEDVHRKEIENIIRKDNAGVCFFPSGVIYPHGLKNVKIAVTIFDLQQEFLPQNFSPAYLRLRKNDCDYVVSRADRIIAISAHTKKTLIDKYGVSADAVAVIYPAGQEVEAGAEENFLPALPERFVFYPAAFWPHKNHKILIGAVNLIKNKFTGLHLVFSGIVKNKELEEELKNLAGILGIADRVHFLGRLSGHALDYLYKKAEILAYPSAFEGFGIPPVEAFNYGVPVIAADNSSIREVVGEAGILVKTGDAAALAAAIEAVLTDAQLREGLIQKGRAQAAYFSWEKTAKETLAVFKNLQTQVQ